MNSSLSSNRLTRPANRKHAARLGNALFHSSGKARDRPAPFSCIRASGRRRAGAAAALDHIVRRATRAGPIAANALARQCTPQSRAFRYRNERRVRSNVVDRRASAPRTGSLRLVRSACTNDVAHVCEPADVRSDSYGNWQLPERHRRPTLVTARGPTRAGGSSNVVPPQKDSR
jgi:hypothetical protein